MLFLILPAALLASPAAQAEDSATLQLYNEYCSVCHGDNGDGQLS
jgi:mono/diheme cytochrome c family protein